MGALALMMASIMALIAAPTCVMLYRGALKLQTVETSTEKERDTVKRNIKALKTILTLIALLSILTNGAAYAAINGYILYPSLPLTAIAVPTCVVIYLGGLKLQTDETSTAKERDSVKRHITVLKVLLTFIVLLSIFTALYTIDSYELLHTTN